MASRKGDITFIIAQNNDQQELLIESVDPSIENIIGYEAAELKGTELRDILLPEVNAALMEYIDFTDEGNDFASVLGRVRDFGFITKLGYSIKLGMRVNRALSDVNKPVFELIVRDHSEVSEGSKSALRNLKGHQIIDSVTGLPEKMSFMKEAEFINFCIQKERLIATIAVISIDGGENFTTQYGEEKRNYVMRELVGRCRVNFRQDDILGSLSEYNLGVILLEANTVAAKIPLNRMRWQIASQPIQLENGEEVHITLSIAYAGINLDCPVEKAIGLCEQTIGELRKSGGNKIQEVR